MKSTLRASGHKRAAERHRQIPSDAAWATLQAEGTEILQARALLEVPWVAHGFSTRLGGVSSWRGSRALNLGFTDWDSRANVLANRDKFLSALGLAGTQVVTLRQFHSDSIHVLESPPVQPLRGDAAITSAEALLLAAQTADCVPILMVDVRHRGVAAVHAGWRGTLRRVAAKTLGRMRMALATRPADVVAVLGPAIGVCCYEVGPEVAQAYAAQFAEASQWFEGPFDRLASGEEPNPPPWLSTAPPGHDPPAPRVRLDLRAANRWQLLDAGVPEPNIVSSDLCTACRTDLLFSYRREGRRTGRLMGVIGLRAV